ncbi:VOC family protein [Rhodococcus wratislaviensis]|uniref:VOC family protein n=1 Tax=Rhodococcus wratislaviensis TaxID=44752 RepID=UPI00351885E1
MSLHRLTSLQIGVPDVAAAISYYRDFGLTADEAGALSTVDGGKQLRFVPSRQRRLLEIGIGVDDPDDLDRIGVQLTALAVPFTRTADTLVADEPVAALRTRVTVSPRLARPRTEPALYNGPGRIDRPNVRAPGVERTNPVQPRKLGHVVIGSLDQDATQRFFTEGIGLKVSDRVPGLASFLRCSEDHHNILVQQAPLNFLHHTAWEVDDVDEVGRGATAMLEGNPERHVWGLGRHHIGSNFFWYLKDPAGNFSEYYSDIDCVVDDQLWKPGVVEGMKGLYSWGPPPPPSFLAPEDLAALMTGAHSAR